MERLTVVDGYCVGALPDTPKPWAGNVREETALAWAPDLLTVCICIREPPSPGYPASFEECKHEGFRAVLRQRFEDWDTLRYAAGDRVVFTGLQAREMAAFIKEHRGHNFLVHCAAGISRSGAVVDAILHAFPEYHDLTGRETRHPNGHVRSFLKRALGLRPVGMEGAIG